MLIKFTDPFAEADEDTGGEKQSQNYIHIRIQRTSFFPLHSPIVPQHEHPLTPTFRAQRSQDLDYCPGSAEEVRPEEDPQGHQEEVRLQWHHRERLGDG